MVRESALSTEKFLGCQLKRDIFNKTGLLIVPALTVLNEEHLQMIGQHQIDISMHDVYPLETPPSNEQNGHKALIDKSVSMVQDIFREVRFENKIPLEDIHDQVIPTIRNAAETSNLFRIFSSLRAMDDYTYRHTIAVGIIASMIGKWLRLPNEELSDLTMAATLCDIGKMMVPEHILNKPGALTAEEFEQMKKHTIYGYELIQSTAGTTHRQALVALQHHERHDGSGYPYGIREKEIDLFSRIVAVADVFHAMSSNKVYRNATPFYETLKQMNQNAYGAFDAKVIHIFLDKMMQSLTGSEVLLTDGSKGNIVMINSHDPTRPLVQVGGNFIDLSKQTYLHIEQVNG
ncbi:MULTISPECIES: HD-GYP domain-containing protein [unclassified Paenibacillus]|uniref:HD-GYP domain-containing protein n=1 Tax=unclassified Paenibacillus TaxID=185978 RepID=UPI001C11C8B5|nr:MULTISPECIES: HD-GYP domain-containing protein [unclassified Paenibacillus]MBU5441364.1 HD-GYP domain-containing protein [Paenibacillus sp. MSJ-34]CAH0118229.1 hypothetical protein PAE9249_00713 [Paenibacillus sp. CECT 9249]